MRLTKIPSPTEPNGERPARLLIVDDEPEIRDLLRRHFRYAGLDVRAAKDGFDALEAMAEQVPDVVVTDIQMPRMNGIQLLERVRAEHPAVHVIIITGYVTPSNILACMRRGAATAVFKPLQDLTKLEIAIEGAIGSIVGWWEILRDLGDLKQAAS